MNETDYAALEAQGWKPRQVTWQRGRATDIEIGIVKGERRFKLLFTTEGATLFDRGERVGWFAHIQAARYVADQRAECIGVVHRAPGHYA